VHLYFPPEGVIRPGNPIFSLPCAIERREEEKVMRVALIAAAITVSISAPAEAQQRRTIWTGSQIAATADEIPVRDLTGRDLPHREYSRPYRPRPRHRGPDVPTWFYIGPTITVGAGDYLPDESSYYRDVRESASSNSGPACKAVSSGPATASSAIAQAARADGKGC
jgi:hypothetical protein